jgi:hypothetical protein
VTKVTGKEEDLSVNSPSKLVIALFPSEAKTLAPIIASPELRSVTTPLICANEIEDKHIKPRTHKLLSILLLFKIETEAAVQNF